ncbi:MAG: AAA family ATPase, partial [Kineosporiaceae bacterium]
MTRTRSVSDALDALASLRFSWAATPDDVWDPGTVHVAGLQSAAERALLLGMDDAWRTPNASPVGLALTGPKGVGKTHLLGWIRRQVQGGDGYFFLVQVLAGTEFWRSVAQGVLDGLLRPAATRRDQLTLLLDSLGDRTDAAPALREVLHGDRAPTRLDLDAFVSGLRRLDRQVGTESADGARALLLYNSPDLAQSDAGRAFLSLADDLDPADRAEWGLQRGRRSPQLVVRDLSRLIALTGQPTVMAVDQLDTLVAQSRSGGATRLGTDEDDEVAVMLDSVADGLMAMREETRRTLTVLSVLPATWRLIRRRATATATDRFREFHLLDAVPSSEAAADLLTAYLAHRYVAVGFEPPHPTWPVAPSALREASRYTARELLQRVDEHARRCVDAGEVAELTSLERVVAAPAPRAPAHALDAHEVLDAEFERHRLRADVAVLLDPESEDVGLPPLLRAALTCFVEEARASGDHREWVVDPPPAPRRPSLHARLRLVLDADTEDERHWAFRAVLVPHHRPVAGRVEDARVAAGAAPGVAKRRLVLLRDRAWATGEPVPEVTGGVVALDHEDVRTFEALRRLVDADPPGLREWLAE